MAECRRARARRAGGLRACVSRRNGVRLLSGAIENVGDDLSRECVGDSASSTSDGVKWRVVVRISAK